MGNAVLTGTVDLATLEVTSTDAAPPKFIKLLTGDMRLNGVRVTLYSDSVDAAVKTINRFTPQTNVTASVSGSSVKAPPVVTAASTDPLAPPPAPPEPPAKHLVLTSPETMRVTPERPDGDTNLLDTLGLVAGTVTASSS
jgi:hypothetical protein